MERIQLITVHSTPYQLKLAHLLSIICNFAGNPDFKK